MSHNKYVNEWLARLVKGGWCSKDIVCFPLEERLAFKSSKLCFFMYQSHGRMNCEDTNPLNVGFSLKLTC
jgi:hypothetical protein